MSANPLTVTSAKAKVKANINENRSEYNNENDLMAFLYQEALNNDMPVDMEKFLKYGLTFSVWKPNQLTEQAFNFEELPDNWIDCAHLYLLKSLEHLKMSFKIRNDIVFQILQTDSGALPFIKKLDSEFDPENRDSQVQTFRKFEDYASSVILQKGDDCDERLVRSLFKALDSRRLPYIGQLDKLAAYVKKYTEDRFAWIETVLSALSDVPGKDLNIKNAGKHERQRPSEDPESKKTVVEVDLIAGSDVGWVRLACMPPWLFKYFAASFTNSINIRLKELQRRGLGISALHDRMRSIDGEIDDEVLLEEQQRLNVDICHANSGIAYSQKEMLCWEHSRTTWMLAHCQRWRLPTNEIYDIDCDDEVDQVSIDLLIALEKGRADSIINGGSPWTVDRTWLIEMWIERIRAEPSCNRDVFDSEKKVCGFVARLREVAIAREGILQNPDRPHTLTNEWESITNMVELNEKIREVWALRQAFHSMQLSSGRIFNRSAYDNYRIDWLQLEDRRSVEYDMCDHIKKAMAIIDQQCKLSTVFSSKMHITIGKVGQINFPLQGKRPAVDVRATMKEVSKFATESSAAGCGSFNSTAKAKKKKRQRENRKDKGKEAEREEDDGEETAVEEGAGEVEEVGSSCGKEVENAGEGAGGAIVRGAAAGGGNVTVGDCHFTFVMPGGKWIRLTPERI